MEQLHIWWNRCTFYGIITHLMEHWTSDDIISHVTEQLHMSDGTIVLIKNNNWTMQHIQAEPLVRGWKIVFFFHSSLILQTLNSDISASNCPILTNLGLNESLQCPLQCSAHAQMRAHTVLSKKFAIVIQNHAISSVEASWPSWPSEF